MGMFNFFSKRRERESALPQAEAESLGSFANPEGQPVVGQQVSSGPGAPGAAGFEELTGLAALSQLGPMIQQAMQQGNVQIEQMPAQTINMQGTGLREEIFEIMRQHGIDPEQGTASGTYDAANYGQMQNEIMAALSKHGLNFGGSTPQIQIQPQDPEGSGPGS